MNQRCTRFLDRLCACRFARLFRRFTKDNVRAIALNRADLHLRGVRGHNDVRRNAA